MSFRALIIGYFGLMAAWAQSPPTPGALNVSSASSMQVQLSWTASSGAKLYAVERKSGGDYASVMNVTDPTALDKSIDPYTTYTYRVIAVNDSGQSEGSNEVVVGPPPFGFQVVAPATNDTANRFGTGVRMELDSNGDPAFAYLNLDPNGDGNEIDDTLFFINWSRARYAWNAPVKVAAIGEAMFGGPSVPVSLARDAATDVWGLAYDLDDAAIMLATSSDGGISWKAQTIADDPTSVAAFAGPSLALWNGSFYLAYLVNAGEPNHYQYVTGKLSDDRTKWKFQDVPMPGAYNQPFNSLSLALDSAHNPGIAFLVSNDSYAATAFWRPASGGASMIIGHADGSADNPDIALSFFGTQPRVVTDTVWNYNLWSQDDDHSVWAMCGVGDGSNWLPAVNVPSDGSISVSAPLSIATGSQGQTAIAMSSVHGGVGDGVCGYPKVARSADFLTFQTCGPAAVHHPDFKPGEYPMVRFGGNDKLWLAFHNWDTNGEIGIGLVLWREQ